MRRRWNYCCPAIFSRGKAAKAALLLQYTRAHLALGRVALARQRGKSAATHFEAALAPPANLGEAKHLLANDSDIQLWLGRA